jgi:hypothetical protein
LKGLVGLLEYGLNFKVSFKVQTIAQSNRFPMSYLKFPVFCFLGSPSRVQTCFCARLFLSRSALVKPSRFPDEVRQPKAIAKLWYIVDPEMFMITKTFIEFRTQGNTISFPCTPRHWHICI